MGTKCAPEWANLTLRSFILQSPAFLAGPVMMWRFLDGGLLIHPQSATTDLVHKLRQTFCCTSTFGVSGSGRNW